MRLAEAGYQVLAVDQRNHGRSSHELPHTYPAMAQDLAVFLEEEGVKRPVLIGHSMGGKTAVQFAIDYPGRLAGLVVVDMALYQNEPNHRPILEGLQAINLSSLASRNDAETTLADYVPDWGTRQFLLKNLARTPKGFTWRFNLAGLVQEYQQVLAAVQPPLPLDLPALFMRGGRSDYISDANWADLQPLFPQASLETLPEAGHWIHADDPEGFQRVLQAFLSGLPADAFS